MDLTSAPREDYYTLLAVRPDGVAPIVDLLADGSFDDAQARARRLLVEHASCSEVEVWRDGALLEKISRD